MDDPISWSGAATIGVVDLDGCLDLREDLS